MDTNGVVYIAVSFHLLSSSSDDQQISIDEYGTAFKLIKEYFFYRIDGAGINALVCMYGA
jgi:hypothetical protein